MAHIGLMKNSTNFKLTCLRICKSPQISKAPTSHTKAWIGLLGPQEDMTITVAYWTANLSKILAVWCCILTSGTEAYSFPSQNMRQYHPRERKTLISHSCWVCLQYTVQHFSQKIGSQPATKTLRLNHLSTCSTVLRNTHCLLPAIAITFLNWFILAVDIWGWGGKHWKAACFSKTKLIHQEEKTLHHLLDQL